MNTKLKHGVTFFRMYANSKWGIQIQYIRDDVPFEEKLNPDPDKAKLFLWHAFYGMVTALTTANGCDIGHAIENCLDHESEDRSSIPEISHVGIYVEDAMGKKTFRVYGFETIRHTYWMRRNSTDTEDYENHLKM